MCCPSGLSLTAFEASVQYSGGCFSSIFNVYSGFPILRLALQQILIFYITFSIITRGMLRYLRVSQAQIIDTHGSNPSTYVTLALKPSWKHQEIIKALYANNLPISTT